MKIVLALPALLIACGLAAQGDDEAWYNDSYHTSYIYPGFNDGTQAYSATDTRGTAEPGGGYGSVGLFGGLGFYNSGFGHYAGGGCGAGGFCPEPRRHLDLWDGYCSDHAVCPRCRGGLNGLYHDTFCQDGRLNTWGRGLKARFGNFCHSDDCGCGCGCAEGDGEVLEPSTIDEPVIPEPQEDTAPPAPPVDMTEEPSDTSKVYLEGAGLDGGSQQDADALYDELLSDPSSD